MSENKEPVQKVVVTTTKSVGISLILTILFGPLGMLYSTVIGGIIMIIVSILVSILAGIFRLDFGLIIIWTICIIWGAVAVSASNKKLLSQIDFQQTDAVDR